MDPAVVPSDEEIRRALVLLKERIVALLGGSLVKLSLFGSRARGDFDPDSDVDVAIVVRDLTPELKSRIFTLVADVELESDVPLSTLVLSEERFTQLLTGERRLALDIEREGIPL